MYESERNLCIAFNEHQGNHYRGEQPDQRINRSFDRQDACGSRQEKVKTASNSPTYLN